MSWLLSQVFTPAGVTFIGALITAAGVFWAARQQFALSSQLVAKSEQLVTKNEELAAKSEEIARLSKDSLAAVTGGDSFCYMTLTARDNEDGPTAVVIQQGKYPLYDVAIRLADMRIWEQAPPPGANAGQFIAAVAAEPKFHPGNMAVTSAAVVGRVPALRGDMERFNVFFSARNGFWTQLIRLRKVAGVWTMATKVIRDDGQPSEKLLFEKVDRGFPVNTAGQVEW